MWCIPPEQNAEFVAKMEDVLDVYALPYDENIPVICMDEKPYQLLGERRKPIPMKPGTPQKIDNEYERNGTCSISVYAEPLTGWGFGHARERRTAADWAHEIEWLLSESKFKNAPKIRLVTDTSILMSYGICTRFSRRRRQENLRNVLKYTTLPNTGVG